MGKVKKEGVITIEEAKISDTYVEVVEGMQFDRVIFHLILLQILTKCRLFSKLLIFSCMIRKYRS